MKIITGVLLIGLYSGLASASNLSGKYQLQLANGLSGLNGSFIFLLNSNNEVKFFEELSDYYIQDWEVTSFFGTLDFEVEWGSDEEQHHFSFTLEEIKGTPVITKSCSLYVDGPNGYHEFEQLSLSLRKWNKAEKKYEEVSIVQNDETIRKCQEELGKRHL